MFLLDMMHLDPKESAQLKNILDQHLNDPQFAENIKIYNTVINDPNFDFMDVDTDDESIPEAIREYAYDAQTQQEGVLERELDSGDFGMRSKYHND